MHIEVRDYFSIRECVLQTDRNLAIVVGLNGCGKSHLLSAVVAACGGPAVAEHVGLPEAAMVRLHPTPPNVVYLPPDRMVQPYVMESYEPFQEWLARHGILGYERPSQVPASSALFLDEHFVMGTAGPVGNAVTRALLSGEIGRDRFSLEYGKLLVPDKRRAAERWAVFRDALERVTHKRLMYDIPDGSSTPATVYSPVGDAASDGPMVCGFEVLSSGEKQAADLLFNMAYCPDSTLFVVDEVERHLHPAMQARLVTELVAMLPQGCFLLATTHSPAIMFSADAESLWWMDASTDAGEGHNQLACLASNLSLVERVFALYAGCSLATRVPEIHRLAADEEFEGFLDECYAPSQAIGQARDGDLQVQSIGTAVTLGLARHEEFRYLDFGCGPGRALAAFSEMQPEDRGRLYLHLVDRDEQSLEGLRRRLADPHGFGGVTISHSLDAVEGIHYAVAANVLHEIPGDQFVDCFVRLWHTLAVRSELHVIEVLRLPKGESGFVSLGLPGYAAFFGALGIRHVQRPHRSRGGLPLVEVVAVRSDARELRSERVMAAYEAALIATRDWCLEELDREPTGRERAFHMQNVVNVVRTLRGLRAD